MNTSAGSFKIVPIGLFLAVIVLVISVQLNSHTMERHPDTGPSAIQCLNQNGADFEMIDPDTNRTIRVCHEPQQPYVWYIIVFTAAGALITAFRRGQAKTRRDAESYLQDRGCRYKRRGE